MGTSGRRRPRRTVESVPPEPPLASSGLEALIGQLFPGALIIAVEPLGSDDARRDDDDDDTLKTGGYGEPARITLRLRDGSESIVVWHTSTPDQLGRDR